MCGLMMTRAGEAPSRDTLRGMLRCAAERALDWAFARAWLRPYT
jgi:hypothetical protein